MRSELIATSDDLIAVRLTVLIVHEKKRSFFDVFSLGVVGVSLLSDFFPSMTPKGRSGERPGNIGWGNIGSNPSPAPATAGPSSAAAGSAITPARTTPSPCDTARTFIDPCSLPPDRLYVVRCRCGRTREWGRRRCVRKRYHVRSQ
jgi:hypothetical protein